MANEVEPKLWKSACAAVKRYFDSFPPVKIGGIEHARRVVDQGYYRTGWIMGYRAGKRSARETGAKE